MVVPHARWLNHFPLARDENFDMSLLAVTRGLTLVGRKETASFLSFFRKAVIATITHLGP